MTKEHVSMFQSNAKTLNFEVWLKWLFAVQQRAIRDQYLLFNLRLCILNLDENLCIVFTSFFITYTFCYVFAVSVSLSRPFRCLLSFFYFLLPLASNIFFFCQLYFNFTLSLQSLLWLDARHAVLKWPPMCERSEIILGTQRKRICMT